MMLRGCGFGCILFSCKQERRNGIRQHYQFMSLRDYFSGWWGLGKEIEQKEGEIVAKMTPKQQRFCDEYLIDLNATQAAIRAGYSANRASEQAYQLLQKTTVKGFIEARMAEKEKSLIADQDEILKYLTTVLRGESQSTEIVVEGTGDGCSEARTIQKEPSEKDRLKAAELLGKRYGLYTDNNKLTVQLPVMFEGEDDIAD